MVRGLRDAGIRRVVLVTGDRADIAESVGRIVGMDTVLADCDPADKARRDPRRGAEAATIMVGDGVNDAPALAAAGVGVALAARGAASSEAADVVLTVERLDALADAIRIAQRSRRIALQAVAVGMGLSLVAMAVAAAGLLPRLPGPCSRRASTCWRSGWPCGPCSRRGPHGLDAGDRRRAGPAAQGGARGDLGVVEQIRAVADALSTQVRGVQPVRALLETRDSDLLPHEARRRGAVGSPRRPGAQRHGRTRP